MRKPNRRHPPANATETGAPIACINYDEAVREGKAIIARVDAQTRCEQIRVGELADKLEPRLR
jgi:hypothetical protein